MFMYQYVSMKYTFSGDDQAFLLRPRVFPRALGCGACEGPGLYTTAQAWVLAGLRGACSGRSKSRELASKSRDCFPPSQGPAEQDDVKPAQKKRDRQVFACCTVYNSSHLAWSPCQLAPRPSLHATAVKFRDHTFVPPRSVLLYVLRSRTILSMYCVRGRHEELFFSLTPNINIKC